MTRSRFPLKTTKLERFKPGHQTLVAPRSADNPSMILQTSCLRTFHYFLDWLRLSTSHLKTVTKQTTCSIKMPRHVLGERRLCFQDAVCAREQKGQFMKTANIKAGFSQQNTCQSCSCSAGAPGLADIRHN